MAFQGNSMVSSPLVRKPGGWRFIIDYRALNKVITNESWQIPSMKEMLQRIGSLKPSMFGVADLTQGFFQMPLHKDCWDAPLFEEFTNECESQWDSYHQRTSSKRV